MLQSHFPAHTLLSQMPTEWKLPGGNFTVYKALGVEVVAHILLMLLKIFSQKRCHSTPVKNTVTQFK